ncbi:MAG: hypothetical protein IPH16_16250 [Haliscomenobacter sp.]|nr:hypothetical protein [Haliscomenobacter sp.]
MKTKLPLLAATFLFAAYPFLCSAQFYLRVSDPQATWKNAPATIEEAVFTLAPHGAFTEVGMYLTFSAKGSESLFAPDLPLEVRFEFQLPKEAMVTDSWLWVDDQIIQAKILDRWTASQIYESIVNRRRDPSILFKDYSGRYRLQIYPLPMGKSRKVKLTFLVPNSWSENEVKWLFPKAWSHYRAPFPTCKYGYFLRRNGRIRGCTPIRTCPSGTFPRRSWVVLKRLLFPKTTLPVISSLKLSLTLLGKRAFI